MAQYGEESACQCRGHEFDPWSGKISHAMEPGMTPNWLHATEAKAPLELFSARKRTYHPENPAHCNEE